MHFRLIIRMDRLLIFLYLMINVAEVTLGNIDPIALGDLVLVAAGDSVVIRLKGYDKSARNVSIVRS